MRQSEAIFIDDACDIQVGASEHAGQARDVTVVQAANYLPLVMLLI